LSQVCRTSIIRDELIAALSLDLTETERFELVRASLGAIIGPDYGAKAAMMLVAAKAAWDQAEKDYELARERLNGARSPILPKPATRLLTPETCRRQWHFSTKRWMTRTVTWHRG
jgi:hypothetical protein